MAIIFNENSVSGQPLGRAATRQRLLTTSRMPAPPTASTGCRLRPAVNFP